MISVRIGVKVNQPTNPNANPNPYRQTAYLSPSYDTYPTNNLLQILSRNNEKNSRWYSMRFRHLHPIIVKYWKV